MSDYKPDKWCLVDVGEDIKVFGTWGGSYLYGSSWRMNSGIESVEDAEDAYLFHGYSGSIYECRKNAYGLTPYGASVLSHAELEPMTEEEAINKIKEMNNEQSQTANGE